MSQNLYRNIWKLLSAFYTVTNQYTLNDDPGNHTSNTALSRIIFTVWDQSVYLLVCWLLHIKSRNLKKLQGKLQTSVQYCKTFEAHFEEETIYLVYNCRIGGLKFRGIPLSVIFMVIEKMKDWHVSTRNCLIHLFNAINKCYGWTDNLFADTWTCHLTWWIFFWNAHYFVRKLADENHSLILLVMNDANFEREYVWLFFKLCSQQ